MHRVEIKQLQTTFNKTPCATINAKEVYQVIFLLLDFVFKMLSVTAYCAKRGKQHGNFHFAIISNMSWRKRAYYDVCSSKSTCTTSSIERFNLQKALNYNITKPWPVKNSSVAHGLRNPAAWRNRRFAAVVAARPRADSSFELHWAMQPVVTISNSAYLCEAMLLTRAIGDGTGIDGNQIKEAEEKIKRKLLRFDVTYEEPSPFKWMTDIWAWNANDTTVTKQR